MPLTTQQRAALVAEIRDDPAGRGYAGKAASEVWDLICVSVSEEGDPIAGSRSITRIDALQQVGGLFGVEVGLRTTAKQSPIAEAILDLWVRLPDFDFTRPFAGGLMDALDAMGIGFTADQRAALVTLCTTSRPGETVESPPRRLVIWGAPLGSVEDVAAALEEIG